MKDEKVFADAADLEFQIDMLEGFDANSDDKYNTQMICWLKELQHRRVLQSGNSAQPVTVPAGYVLVPVEPTTNQWAAGMQAFDSGMDKVTRVYKAMLAAAPKIPDAPKAKNVIGHYQGADGKEQDIITLAAKKGV